MADISSELLQIRSAIYGSEVRTAIANALQKVSESAGSGSTSGPVDGGTTNPGTGVDPSVFNSLIDDILHKNRLCKNYSYLGDHLTEEQKAAIKNGSFDGMFVGDYWEKDGIIWRIVDLDYWYGRGSETGGAMGECKTHHINIMPDSGLYTGVMNSTAITTNGYVESTMFKTGLNNAIAMIESAFGKDNLLVHSYNLCNSTKSGLQIGSSWYNRTVDIPNEVSMYGTYVLTGAPTGEDDIVRRHTTDYSQLALMRNNGFYICPKRENCWLRDVVSSKAFATVYNSGFANSANANASSIYVRPIFGLTGGN